MTDDEVLNGCTEVVNGFWNKYKDRQPKETSSEWERMHTHSALLRKKYPFMERTINAMLTEITERARGRGSIPGDFHRPPT